MYEFCKNNIKMQENNGYLTKTICVMPKQKLSIQSHNFRSEHWVVLEGKALVILNDEEHYLNSGDSIDIPLKAKHSLQNPYDEELKIIEVQKERWKALQLGLPLDEIEDDLKELEAQKAEKMAQKEDLGKKGFGQQFLDYVDSVNEKNQEKF